MSALDPANSIIERFGGPEAVMKITGASRTRVYRWTQPRIKGGTGGVIPYGHAQKLLKYAREFGVPISEVDFFGPLRRGQRP